jgi:histidine triad (HIT) family protein
MTGRDCLFCKIAAGEIPTQRIYEDDQVIAFSDINPQAPFHALVIPRQHIATLNDLKDGDSDLMGRLFLAAQAIADQEGFGAEGYRTVVNCNAGAGQTVFHIHVHLLAGRPLGWPPG